METWTYCQYCMDRTDHSGSITGGDLICNVCLKPNERFYYKEIKMDEKKLQEIKEKKVDLVLAIILTDLEDKWESMTDADISAFLEERVNSFEIIDMTLQRLGEIKMSKIEDPGIEAAEDVYAEEETVYYEDLANSYEGDAES